MRCLLVLIFLPYVTSSCPLIYADRIKAYDDKRVSKSPMWTWNDLRKSECILRCNNETSCHSVQFNSPASSCTAFRERFKDVTVAVSPQSGHSLYQMGKFRCEEEVDCDSLPNSQCHEGSCRCDQGYDADGDTCRILTDCTSLGTDFTRYPKTSLFENDMQNYQDKTVSECVQFCLGHTTCTSFDYNFASGHCLLKNKQWTAADPVQRRTIDHLDFYQRGCNW